MSQHVAPASDRGAPRTCARGILLEYMAWAAPAACLLDRIDNAAAQWSSERSRPDPERPLRRARRLDQDLRLLLVHCLSCVVWSFSFLLLGCVTTGNRKGSRKWHD